MMGVSHALMIRHSRRLPNEIIMLELFSGNNSQEANGIIIAFPSPGRLLSVGMKLVVKSTLHWLKGQRIKTVRYVSVAFCGIINQTLLQKV